MAEEAEPTKRELKRRLLMASKRSRLRAEERPKSPFEDTRRIAVVLAAIAIPLIALTLYLSRGRPELPGAPVAERTAERAAAGIPSAEERALVEQLAVKMVENPENLEGWALLGDAYVRLGQYDDAVDAYAQALELKGPDAGLLSALGEALVLRADGLMTEESRFAFESALEISPEDPRARYFLALDKAQNGDLQGAVEDWASLLEGAPENAPWRLAVQAQIERAGRTIMEQLTSGPRAPAGPLETAQAPALDPETAAAAQDLSPEARQDMIEGMVDRLAARLEENPKDLEGWLRLARSYSVLGKRDEAVAALAKAEKVFANDFAALAAITQARGELEAGVQVDE